MPSEQWGKTDKPDRLNIVLAGFAKHVRGFGLPGTVKAADEAKLAAEMTKSKKPAVMTFVYEKGVFTAKVEVGSLSDVLLTVNVAAEKDPAKRRSLLEKINASSSVVNQKDLDAHDKANPDPQKLAAAKAEVDRLKTEVTNLTNLKKSRKSSFDKMDRGEQEIGLTNWAKTKNYDRYVTCLFWIDVGRDAKTVVDEFLKEGAARPVKISDAARKEAVDSLAAGKPKLTKAKAEVKKVVDTVLVPLYNKETAAALDKQIKARGEELKKAVKAWQELGGK